jgi:hypothetical protein
VAGKRRRKPSRCKLCIMVRVRALGVFFVRMEVGDSVHSTIRNVLIQYVGGPFSARRWVSVIFTRGSG